MLGAGVCEILFTKLVQLRVYTGELSVRLLGKKAVSIFQRRLSLLMSIQALWAIEREMESLVATIKNDFSVIAVQKRSLARSH